MGNTSIRILRIEVFLKDGKNRCLIKIAAGIIIDVSEGL